MPINKINQNCSWTRSIVMEENTGNKSTKAKVIYPNSEKIDSRGPPKRSDNIEIRTNIIYSY